MIGGLVLDPVSHGTWYFVRGQDVRGYMRTFMQDDLDMDWDTNFWLDFAGIVRPEPEVQIGDVRVCYVPHPVAGSKLVVLRQRKVLRKRWRVVDEVLLPVRLRRSLASDKLPAIARKIGRGFKPRDAVRIVLGKKLMTP